MCAEMTPDVTLSFDELDRRIVGALQVDGRASWHRIADVLGEQERTVTRRGARLIKSGLVRVTGLALRGEGVIVGARCSPGQSRVAATALARREDTLFTHVLTGSVDCVAMISCPRDQMATLIMDELPATPGVAEFFSHEILRYVRSAHEWHPGLISDAEEAALAASSSMPERRHFGDIGDLQRSDQLLLHALAGDARRTYDELARLTGLSETTARRHLDRLRREGRVLIRAVVDPARIGLRTAAMLWVTTKPADVNAVADGLRRSPYVRYATRISGDRQFLVDVALPTPEALDDFVSNADWVSSATQVETSVVLAAIKRSGVLMTQPGTARDALGRMQF